MRWNVAFRTWEMIVARGFGDLLRSANSTPIEVHEATIQRGMRKDHATPTPVAGRVRPRARRRIAHAMLLCQSQGNAPLLQVRFATTAGQSGLKYGELV